MTVVRTAGAYIIKAAETRSRPVQGRMPPPGYVPPAPTARDRAVAAALLALRPVGGRR